MLFEIFTSFLISFFVGLILVIWTKKIFYSYQLLDKPKKYRKKRDPIPYGIGIIFFLCFFLCSFLLIDPNMKLFLLWWFGAIITFLSFIDDRVQVSPKIRLGVQIIIWATIALTSIKIGYISGLFWGIIELESYFLQVWSYTWYIIPFFFTIIWYVFVFNALNWSDGIAWNTSGLSIISFFILFLLWVKLYMSDTYAWWIENAEFIMKVCVILLGALLPFWFFDVREKVLMWDSGTMFLGFMLASMAIIAGGKIATVLVVFWLYSVDAMYVILKRLQAKKIHWAEILHTSIIGSRKCESKKKNF